MSPTPTATCRVQLHPRFGFAELAEVLPTIAALGHSHVYLFPILQAVPDSTHGHDVVDPTAWSDIFDVEWQPPHLVADNQVLLPVLGDHLGSVLEAGDLQVERHGASFVFPCFEHRFPLSPRSVGKLLSRVHGDDQLAFIADTCTCRTLTIRTGRRNPGHPVMG